MDTGGNTALDPLHRSNQLVRRGSLAFRDPLIFLARGSTSSNPSPKSAAGMGCYVTT